MLFVHFLYVKLKEIPGTSLIQSSIETIFLRGAGALKKVVYRGLSVSSKEVFKVKYPNEVKYLRKTHTKVRFALTD